MSYSHDTFPIDKLPNNVLYCIVTEADPGFDQGGGPDRDRPKTAILGPQFWCWGLIFGGQGGPGPRGPPWIRPCR